MRPDTNIKYWRKKRGISQKDLAEIIGISKSYISDIESHKKLPSFNVLYKIAEALEVCPKQLIKCDCLKCQKCCYKS